MTMMHERTTQGVELPSAPSELEAGLAVLALPVAPAQETLAPAGDTDAQLSGPISYDTKPEAQSPEPQVTTETAHAVGSLSLSTGERSASLVNWQDQADERAAQTRQTPQERLDAAVARWGGKSQDTTRYMQERNARAVRAGGMPYSVVTALTNGYPRGFRG